MRILAILLVALALFGGDLKIATYNVENLFDGEDNGNEYEDFRIENGKWNKAKFDEKIAKIANEIIAINADIIALQEIENEGVLKNLAHRSKYEFYRFSNPPTAPAGVAILSKIPIKSHEYYRMQSVKTRDILRADFEHEGAKFSLFVVHMLSARNPLADRKKSFDFLNQIIKNKKFSVVLGDFNTGLGKNSLLNEILSSGKFSDLWGFSRCYSSLNIACNSHDSGALLDHILLSNDFFEGAKFGYQKNSFNVENALSSDHHALSFILSSQNVVKNPAQIFAISQKKDKKGALNSNAKEAKIDEIYGVIIKDPFLLKEAVVTYINRHGFAISQGQGGVFVYGNTDVKVGDKIDLLAQKTKKYKGNFEISDAKIIKNHGNIGEIDNYTLKSAQYHKLRAGDVLSELVGDIEDGYIISNHRKYKIYSKKSKLKNQKNAKFKNAYFTIYEGEKEFVVE